MDFIDLKTQYRTLKASIDARIQKVLDHGQYVLGPEVAELEQRLATYVGAKHAVACASGTDALLLALMALDIKPGDEVITCPFTFVATAEMIVLLGAKPILVDVEPDTCNLDPRAPRARDHAAHAGDHAGRALRAAGGHGRDQRDRRQAQPRGDRRRRAELRCELQRTQELRALDDRLHELLPVEAARLLRRRRRGVHRRRRPRPALQRDPPPRQAGRYHHTRLGSTVGSTRSSVRCCSPSSSASTGRSSNAGRRTPLRLDASRARARGPHATGPSRPAERVRPVHDALRGPRRRSSRS